MGQVIQVRSGAFFPPPQSTQVPGLYGSVATVGLSAVATGDLEGWLDGKGKTRSAPPGGSLVGLSYASNQDDKARLAGQKQLAFDGPAITIAIQTPTTRVEVATLTGLARISQTTWLVALPADAATGTLDISADGGHQVLSLATGQRDDAASNGLPITQAVPASVTSNTNCDAEAVPPTAAPAGFTFTSSTTCTARWALVSHDSRAGWAPPGSAWLTMKALVVAPDAAYGKGWGGYGNVTSYDFPAVTAGQIPATKIVRNPDDSPVGKRLQLLAAFPVKATTSVDATALTARWHAERYSSVNDGKPPTLTATTHLTITANDTSATITQPDTP